MADSYGCCTKDEPTHVIFWAGKCQQVEQSSYDDQVHLNFKKITQKKRWLLLWKHPSWIHVNPQTKMRQSHLSLQRLKHQGRRLVDESISPVKKIWLSFKDWIDHQEDLQWWLQDRTCKPIASTWVCPLLVWNWW